MVETYQGYFQNGRFISHEIETIPENVKVYIMITGENTSSVKTKTQQQLDALDEFLIAIKESRKDEPIDNEFDEIIRRGVQIGKEIDL